MYILKEMYFISISFTAFYFICYLVLTMGHSGNRKLFYIILDTFSMHGTSTGPITLHR